VEDKKTWQEQSHHARGLLTLFEAIGKGKAVNTAAAAVMVDILKRQKCVAGIHAGLPPGTPVIVRTCLWCSRAVFRIRKSRTC